MSVGKVLLRMFRLGFRRLWWEISTSMFGDTSERSKCCFPYTVTTTRSAGLTDQDVTLAKGSMKRRDGGTETRDVKISR